MRRIAILFTILVFMAGSVIADNAVDIQVNSGDTIWLSEITEFEVWIENDWVLGGFSLGFQFWSPDGATWDWDFTGCPGWGGWTVCRSIVPGSRMDPWPFDMTGPLLTTEQNVDEIGRDTVMSGGVALMQGMEAGPLEHMYSYYFVAEGDELSTICIDSCFVPPSGAFVFVDRFGAPIWPTTLWPSGGRCWPIKFRNHCPVWDIGLPDTLYFSYCETAIIELSATDPEGDPIHFTIEDYGTGCAQYCTELYDHGDGTMTLEQTVSTYYEDQFITVSLGLGDTYHPAGLCDPDYEVTMYFTHYPPILDCSSEIHVDPENSYTITRSFDASDPDTCEELTFYIVSGPGYIDPVTGEFSWTPDPSDLGEWEVCVEVSDGMYEDQCCFGVSYFGPEPYRVKIEKVHDIYQGHFAEVDVCLNSGDVLMGGFDFLIGYDASALAFTEAALGDFFVDCGWEYFTYRFNWNGNCGNACPTGLIRLIGLAETNNGPNHPDWNCLSNYIPGADCVECGTPIATLTFYVTNDRTFECQYVPIRFYWDDCNDNSISSVTGDSLFVSDHVYDFEGTEITDSTYGFPTYYGIPDDPCMDGDKVVPIRLIDFCNGGIDIVCADSIDKRGDINVNGIANEIADAVMFTNYFVAGLPIFGWHWEGSIAASDVNADGIPLSVADLVYMVRIIIGDASPYPKPIIETPVTVNARDGVITYNSPVDLGAALLTFQVNGDIGTPQLGSGAATMNMKYAREGNELRVLIYNIGSEMIATGENILVTVPGEVELTGAEVASYDGFGLNALVHNMPKNFTVTNYPNPFNPSTKIALSLPEASDWAIKIYNITGQLVADYSGYNDAGIVEIRWDGNDRQGQRVASGIYFYKAEAGKYKATKKMMLTK